MGNEEAIKAALEELGSVVGETKRGWVHASCPMAAQRHEGGVDKNPSFGVSYNCGESHKQEGHAHCFSCGYSGDIRDIAALQFAYNEIDAATFATVMELMEQVETGVLPLSLSNHHVDDPFPEEGWLQSFPPLSESHTHAVSYLEGRGLSLDVVRSFDARFDPQRYRVSFPLIDRAQRFRGLIGRTLIPNPDGPRYFYYPYKGNAPRGFTWFNEHNLDLSKPVLVVEGIFDLLKAWQVYPNTTAALSIAFRTPGLGWQSGVSRWVTMFDVGQGGQRARERMRSMVPGARIWDLPPPPGRDDPGDATPEEISLQLQTLTVA